MVIALEGLPGSGKTTTARNLARRLRVKALIESTAEHPFIDSIYRDEDRHDLQVELTFLLLHFDGYRRIDRSATTVSDFSPIKDLLFAEDMLERPENLLFRRTFRQLYGQGHEMPDVVLYLDLGAEACLERIRRRSRPYEKRLTLDRLQRMERLYRKRMRSLGRQVIPVSVTGEMSKQAVTTAALRQLARHTPVGF